VSALEEHGRRGGRWVGVSADDRRTCRRGLLLDAAFDLLGTEGWSGTTVRAVCNAAQLNPRYFYESFDDLDSLVVAVYDRTLDELRIALVAALDAAPLDMPSQMRAAVDATVRFVDDDRRRGRVLYVEALGSEALNRRRISAGHDLTSFIVTDAAARRGAAPAGEPIGVITASVYVGAFSEVLVAWLDGHIDVGREQLVHDLTALFLGVHDAATNVAIGRNAVTSGAGRPVRTRR
jgi:AcrR family transcriptional regulator